MDMDLKQEIAWEEDLDPDAEPTIDLKAASLPGFTCGFCEQVFYHDEELLTHATTEHDISRDAFAGVPLRDMGAVREAFCRAANMRREFVSFGDVERCPKCSILFASAALLAAHHCSAAPDLADPLSINKPRDPLLVPKVDAEQAKSRWKRERNAKISSVLNSLASPVLVNRIVKPLAKPKISLTVGNIFEMSLVEKISRAGLKVTTPEDYDEEAALNTIHRLCLLAHKDMPAELKPLPPNVCLHLLQLLRSRRIRVPASTAPIIPNTAAPAPTSSIILVGGNPIPLAAIKPMNSRLRTLLPAPCEDGSHLTVMESLIEESIANQPLLKKKKGVHLAIAPAPPVLISSPMDSDPPPTKHTKEANFVCDACHRSFESEYVFIKHMQWQSFDQKEPEPLFCRFCPDRDRYFAFCEKGFKSHVYCKHKLPDDYVGTLSLNGFIQNTYSCGHCQKRKPKIFTHQNLLRRHLSTCCRRAKCKICPAYFKTSSGKPLHKKKKHQKTIPKKSVEKRKMSYILPKGSIQVNQNFFCNPVQLIEQNLNLAAGELQLQSNIKTEVPTFEVVIIKEERAEAEAEGLYQCVACDFKFSTTRKLREHFTSAHPTLVDEFQVSVSRCGSVSIRWVCPLCGQIFCLEETFLGHLGQHNITPDSVLAKSIDLRHMPSLRAALLDLKSARN